jgi:hypothetical protein
MWFSPSMASSLWNLTFDLKSGKPSKNLQVNIPTNPNVSSFPFLCFR